MANRTRDTANLVSANNLYVDIGTDRVGIGTTNPIQKVQVGSRSDLVTVVVATGATIGVTTTIITGISTVSITTGLEIVSISGIIATGTTVTGIGSTSITIGTASLNGSQQNNVSLTFAARNDGNLVVITGIGSVGIGTTNPTSKLQVNGDIKIDDGGTFQTVLQVITPTANRVISLPNRTGTVGLVAGSSSQLTYNLLGNQEGATGLTYNNTQQTFTITGLTTTTNTPVLNIAQTWNASGVSFNGVSLNFTNTASAAGSALMNFQLGGTRQFAIGREGHFIGNNGGTAGLLEQRSSTQAQTYRIYNTYTDGSNYERGKLEWSGGVLRIGTERLGTGSPTNTRLDLQTDGTTRVAITTTGNVGVGTTNPTSKLQVIGTVTATSFSGDGTNLINIPAPFLLMGA
jgi:hypothetical protein